MCVASRLRFNHRSFAGGGSGCSVFGFACFLDSLEIDPDSFDGGGSDPSQSPRCERIGDLLCADLFRLFDHARIHDCLRVFCPCGESTELGDDDLAGFDGCP